jgi:TonB family protein
MKTTFKLPTYFKAVSALLPPLFISFIFILSSCVAGKKVSTAKMEISHMLKTSGQGRLPYILDGNDTIYLSVYENPAFPGGKTAFQEFESRNLKYPKSIKKLGISGIEAVGFIVDKDGKLSDIRVIQGTCPSLDAEALRVTKLMPSWSPGKVDGKPVRTMAGVIYQFETHLKKEPEMMVEKKPGETVNVTPEDPDAPYVVVEEMPQFPGGDAALLKHIAENTKYPENAKKNNIQGRVIVRFCITREGTVDRASVIKGVDPDLDNEAIRVVKTLSSFQPGKQRGKPVNVWYMVPITFALAEKGDGTSGAKETGSADKENQSFLKQGFDELHVFPGGEAAMYKFINSNIKYVGQSTGEKISKTVSVMFCINTDGTVGSVSAFNKSDPGLDKEAIRVVSMLPSWIPGKLKSVPVKVWYRIPVTFSSK